MNTLQSFISIGMFSAFSLHGGTNYEKPVKLFTENSNDHTTFSNVINDERNTMDLLAILELGKSLMCCCRLHYSFRDEPVVKDQRVLNRYIKFSSCSRHMDESLAFKKTITLDQLG